MDFTMFVIIVLKEDTQNVLTMKIRTHARSIKTAWHVSAKQTQFLEAHHPRALYYITSLQTLRNNIYSSNPLIITVVSLTHFKICVFI